MNAFDVALAFTLPAEGGESNNAADRGHLTQYGVTQATYDIWRDDIKQPRRLVTLMTAAEIASIYEWMYWQPAHCGDMPLPLAVAHFDWSVNHGISGANETLQLCLGVKVDGNVGPQTLAAVAAVVDPLVFAMTYNERRRTWYRERVAARPDQGVFLKGWLGRVDRLDAYIGGVPA